MTSVFVTQTTINASVVQESVSVSVTSSPINVTISPVDINSHSAVTIGTANGLSLSGQVLSLGLSSALATGALSSTDWSTFNNKQNALGYTPVNIASVDWIDLTDGGATVLHSHAGGGAVWGAITGTLSDQTDLQTALDAKQNSLTFPIASNLGGTGISNAGTITNASNTIITGGGTVALGGFTLTVPATLTVAGLAIANVFTAAQMIDGTADAIQLRVQGHSTQTSVFQTWEMFDGTVKASLTVNGEIGLGIAPVSSRSIHALNALRVDGTVFLRDNRDNAMLQQSANSVANNRDAAFGGSLYSTFRIPVKGIGIGLGSSGGVSVADVGQIAFLVQFNTSGGTFGRDTVFIGEAATGSANKGGDFLVTTGAPTTSGAAGFSTFTTPTLTANAVQEVMRLRAIVSTGATGSANGFGTGLSWYAETATDGTYQQQGLISTSWIDATNASRKAKMSLSAYDTAERVGLTIDANGTVPVITTFGQTMVDGGSDVIQLRVQGHSTQSTALQTWELSTAVAPSQVNGNGSFTISPGVTFDGAGAASGVGNTMQVSYTGSNGPAAGTTTATTFTSSINISNALGNRVFEGFQSRVVTESASASSTTATLIGGSFAASNDMNNTASLVKKLTAGSFAAMNTRKGYATTMVSGEFFITAVAGVTGTTTDAININIAGNAKGGQTWTNQYGIKIENINLGGTLNYSIFTGAGLVHFGDSLDLASGKNITLIAGNIVTDTTTGTKIGTATSQKLSLWNKAPDVQPTNAITAAAFVANTSGIVNDTATFGGYTIGQIAAALIRIGALA